MKSLKAKLIICSINIILIVFLGISLTLGWFARGDSVRGIEFSILKIDSTVTMYEGNDINYNGIPDLLDTPGMYRSDNTVSSPDQTYETTYYTEKYDFTYVDKKTALSESTDATLLNKVSITGMYPSRTYVYKFCLANIGDAENTIKFSFAGESGLSEDYLEVLKYMDVRLNVIADDGTVVQGDWYSFSDVINGTDLSELVLENENYNSGNIYLPSIVTDPDGYWVDLWLQVRLSPDADNTVMGQSIDLPKFSIYFQVVSDD